MAPLGWTDGNSSSPGLETVAAQGRHPLRFEFPETVIYLSTPDRIPKGPWKRRAHRIVLKGLGGGILYGMIIEPRWLETTWIDFPVPGLPHALDGYRIAHLTDLHHNLVTGDRYFRRVAERVNALEPDLIALTGDYITHNPDRMHSVARWMGILRAPDGVFATLGNHDYHYPVATTRRLFEHHGARLLDDEHAVLYPSRRVGSGAANPADEEETVAEALVREALAVSPFPSVGSARDAPSAPDAAGPLARTSSDSRGVSFAAHHLVTLRDRWRQWLRTTKFHRGMVQPYYEPPLAYLRIDPTLHPVFHHPPEPDGLEAPPCLCVVGVGDLWEGRCDLEAAVQGAPRGVFRLLLSHNPEVANLITPRHRIGLMLSGHTHGGQAWPLHRAPVRQTHTRRYLRGFVRSHATNVYVSRGVGSSAFHFRWNCQPEITLIRLLRAEPKD